MRCTPKKIKESTLRVNKHNWNMNSTTWKTIKKNIEITRRNKNKEGTNWNKGIKIKNSLYKKRTNL